MRLWFRQSAFPSRQLVQKRPVSGERLVAALRPSDDAVPPEHERTMLEDLFPAFARGLKHAVLPAHFVAGVREYRKGKLAVLPKSLAGLLRWVGADGHNLGPQLAELLDVVAEGEQLPDAVVAVVAVVENQHHRPLGKQSVELVVLFAVIRQVERGAVRPSKEWGWLLTSHLSGSAKSWASWPERGRTSRLRKYSLACRAMSGGLGVGARETTIAQPSKNRPAVRSASKKAIWPQPNPLTVAGGCTVSFISFSPLVLRDGHASRRGRRVGRRSLFSLWNVRAAQPEHQAGAGEEPHA